MQTSTTAIANLALGHLAIDEEIGDLDTEKSVVAGACRRFFDQARQRLLREFAWPFATATVDLQLVANSPTVEWDYSYRAPADCVLARRIPNGISRRETQTSRVPYRLAQDAQGLLIYTDQVNAQLEYTADVTDVTRFDPIVVEALSLLLAWYIAPRVTGGDPFKLGDRAFKLYELSIEKAKAMALNEEQPDPPVDSSFITFRDDSLAGQAFPPGGAT